jgi:uncharacterized protein (TIGR02996 family)
MAPRNPALEAAILDTPGSLDGYRVYGDWLQQRGDPRGELMVLCARRHEIERVAPAPEVEALRAAEKELWERHGAAIKGALAGLSRVALRWELGSVAAASLRLDESTSVEDLAAVLAHPAAFCLRELAFEVGYAWDFDLRFQPFADVVAEEAPLSLAILRIGEEDQLRERFVLGELRPLYGRHHANLRELSLMGRASTPSAPQGLPNLRKLSLTPVGLTRSWTRAIVRDRWPALRTLRIDHVEDEDYAWLRFPTLGDCFPALRRLEIVNARAPAVLAAFEAGGLRARLVHDTSDASCVAFVAPRG